MEDYAVEKPKSHRKLIILLIIVAAIIIFLGYNQFSPIAENSGESDCLNRLSEWCTECFVANDYHFDIWINEGSKIGEDLAECSNTYLDTGWDSNQYCTGSTLNYCISYIEE